MKSLSLCFIFFWVGCQSNHAPDSPGARKEVSDSIQIVFSPLRVLFVYDEKGKESADLVLTYSGFSQFTLATFRRINNTLWQASDGAHRRSFREGRFNVSELEAIRTPKAALAALDEPMDTDGPVSGAAYLVTWRIFDVKLKTANEVYSKLNYEENTVHYWVVQVGQAAR